MLPLSRSQLLDPRLTSIGRLEARASLTAYPDEAALGEVQSPLRQSLDGIWRFQLIDHPGSAPDKWAVTDSRAAPWRDIQVPGVWTRQNTGDLPHYANWQMPFDCQKPPAIPDANPTGLYRRTIQLPDGWGERQTVLHLGGFESMVLVWCNGSFVGMGKDSRLPSEFDLSDALHPGKNELALMVLRWCDATWIEDQDHWNHGGLHRSVWLESRGAVHVRDLVIDTDFDSETRLGHASVRVEVEGESSAHSVQARLESDDGAILQTISPTPIAQFDTSGSLRSQWSQSYRFDGYAASFDLSVDDAQPWSAERPTRYRLVTELLDAEGACQEVHETWIGFSRIEVSERRLLVNGKPIVLIGVNRHDHHHENGKTCSEDDIRADLLTMKRHNINAIRTAHYPNDPVLLDLADELGFYVIDEANVECHARWTEVAQDPAFLPAIVERTTRMIARDRNHPSVIAWSLGNEAGHGPAHDAAAGAARHLDPTRFVHYEGAAGVRLSFPFGKSPDTTQQPPSATERAATDVACPMYPPIDHIVDWARWAEATGEDDRPMILCEFSHAMGNSNGSISSYVDAFFQEPALAGGFVWDWRDQGLAETDENGKFYWAYGGHFGDTPNDANFNINGLIGPDGTPHPALREYMWAARLVTARLNEARQVVIENRRVFEDTRDLTLKWELLKDGVSVEQGQFELVLEPREVGTLDLPFSSELDECAEWHFTVSSSLREASDWAPAGHQVAWDQFALSAAPREEPSFLPARAITQPLPFEGLKFEFDAEGELVQIGLGADAMITTPITPCLWRAPTDNDGGKPGARPLFQSKTAEWVEYGLNALQPGPIVKRDLSQTGSVGTSFEREWLGEAGQKMIHRSVWRLSEGAIVIDEAIIIPGDWKDLPRVGVRFEVAPRFKELEWFGLGPDESYPDRHGAQTVGRWTSSIADQYHPYVRPQEYGAHEQCRWFRLLDEAGAGLQVTLPEPLSFTARAHHDATLNEAETLAELAVDATTEVHIDAGLRGLGTGACGPDALDEYLLGPGTYEFRWQLSALASRP